MASTFTTRLRLEKQATGENANTWGDKTNTNFDLIDESINGYASKSVAGSSNVTLTNSNATADETRQKVLEFTGTLTGDINVLLPTVESNYIVFNNTAGSQTLTVATTGIADIDNNKRKLVRVTDILGQETPYRRNTPLLYIFDNGTVEKKIVVE